MNDLPKDIFRKWGHSFEEDTDDIMVYKPADYAFPLARGRAGIQFMPDGTFIDWGIAPTDAQQKIVGNWHIVGTGRIQITFKKDLLAPRNLEILQCSTEELKVRQI
jgi:hypothetical protein